MQDTNNDYDLDFLIKTFENHHIEAEKQNKIQEEKYREEFSKPLPYDNSFSLPLALMTICKHIQGIEKEIIHIMKQPVKDILAFCQDWEYDVNSLTNATKRKQAVSEILKGIK